MKLRFGTGKEVGMCETRLAKLESLQQEWVDRGVAPIMVSLIARKGVIVSHKLFVHEDYHRDYGPVGLNTLFQLSSISKPVTATALMLLVEEGRVALELPVQDYIPELTGPGKEKLLVKHLLTHTSGITEDYIWSKLKGGEAEVDLSECPSNLHPDVYRLLTAGYDAPLAFTPGTRMSYCNYGFLLATEMIRRVTGLNIHEFATERMFRPLGMNDSYFIVPPERYGQIAKHPVNAPFPRFADYENLIRPTGSDGFCSTAYDMAILGQTFLNQGVYNGFRLLSKLGVQAMTTNQIPGVSSQHGEEFFKEASWGLGWNISGTKLDYTGTLRSPRTFSHSGRGNTLFMVDPDNELITINLQVTMKRIQARAYHYFEYFNNAALASILE
jgi:serine-type D-Ala-D-Ala carboxypeptidase